MNVDGSSVPVGFYYTVPDGSRVTLYEQNIDFLCNLTPRAGEYGDLAELTNGLSVTWYDANDNVIFGNPSFGVKTNYSFARGGGEFFMPAFGLPHTAFSIHFHNPLGLALKAGDYVEALVQDDLSGLLEHSTYITGVHS
jgi:hypothetical protein